MSHIFEVIVRDWECFVYPAVIIAIIFVIGDIVDYLERKYDEKRKH